MHTKNYLKRSININSTTKIRKHIKINSSYDYISSLSTEKKLYFILFRLSLKFKIFEKIVKQL